MIYGFFENHASDPCFFFLLVTRWKVRQERKMFLSIFETDWARIEARFIFFQPQSMYVDGC